MEERVGLWRLVGAGGVREVFDLVDEEAGREGVGDRHQRATALPAGMPVRASASVARARCVLVGGWSVGV